VASPDAPLVDARALVRGFGGRRAVDGVDLQVAPGERVAVVGPNGAGKTTLLRIAATLLRRESGTLELLGWTMPDQAQQARRQLGYLGHDPMVYLDLSAQQNLELFADLYGIDDVSERIAAALSRVGLLARSHDAVRTFSRGMAQRLGIARLTLHEPRLLLLDEPYTGLDSRGAQLLDDLVGNARPDGGIVMVTHELDRALAGADRVMVMHRGRVAADLTTSGMGLPEFRERYAELTA
jgi:heme exporter protein A